ncbi:MAG: ATP-binding protein [Oscillospiraceae bacterium]
MSLDGKLLARAKTRLDRRRTENEEAAARRREEAYSKNPRIREIDARLRGTMMDTIGVALGSGRDPLEALDAIRDENLTLQEERTLELAACGLPGDYLDNKYICPKCRDTGYDGTRICSCLMELYRDEQRRELSGLLKLGEETFDSFDLSLYDDKPDPETGISPREAMETVYEMCREYARKFSKNSMNLFLSGGTGLGKTFLSTCIAKVVSEKGFSVVYDTAASVFSRYEDDKFSKSGDPEQSRADVRRLETCDLLIVDDLGTEFSTAFVTSALYTLINSRLTSGKKTIISSNLSLKELSSRYSAPIMSRLQGEFYILKFYGRDIRLIKKYR